MKQFSHYLRQMAIKQKESIHLCRNITPTESAYSAMYTFIVPYILHVLSFNHHNIPLKIPKKEEEKIEKKNERHKVEIRKEKPEYKSIQSVPVIILLLVIQKIFFFFF